MLTLYASPTSPFVRKILVLLRESGLIDQVTVVSVSGTPTEPGTMPMAQNPLGKIPTLERSDGPAIYDSRNISRYLSDLAGGGFYPVAPRLWETLTLEATADGICEAAILMIYESRVRPEEVRYAPWVESQWSKITRALDAIESRWMSHLAGPLDCGQIAVGCALGYIDLRFDDRNWRAGRPALTAWEAQFAKRESMLATRPV